MMGDHATWPEGGVGVEIGLVELYERMTTGRFKVFSHLSDFFEEKMSYHRDETGKIVKLNDDILSATRYAYMMRRNALQRFQCVDQEAGQFHANYDPYGA
ncbi:hypothetical protein D9M71_609490 [compost metagenome]